MNFDLTTAATCVPALFSPDLSTARRTLEFFTADIRNANTRRAYARAGADFAGWCSGVRHFAAVFGPRRGVAAIGIKDLAAVFRIGV
jgi:hypothetical protein